MANPTTCYYHPEARGTASCPNCKQLICDRCRLNGNSRRCASCETAARKGELDASRPKRVICINHAGIPADMTCVQCQRPYCPSCLNTAGRCFRCGSSQPRPAQGVHRQSSVTTPLRSQGTGKLSKPSLKEREPLVLSVPTMLMMAVSMFILGAGVVVLLMRHAQAGPVRGPLHVAIVAPSHRASLTGGQNIKLKVSSAQDIARVELTIDGKYWDRFKAPPFDSPWPTSLFANGRHVIVAKAIYRDRQEATTQLVVTTWNRP